MVDVGASEGSVIGCVLLNSQLFSDSVLDSTDFTISDYQKIWDAFGELTKRGDSIDPLSVAQFMEAKGYQNDYNQPWLRLLTECYTNIPSSANYAVYERLVKDAADSRKLQFSLFQAITQLKSGSKPDDVRQEVEKALQSMEKGEGEVNDSVADNLPSYVDTINQRVEGLIKPLTTGFKDFDNAIGGGLLGGKLYVVGARPSMGKSTFVGNIGAHVALEHQKFVTYFSLEMPKTECIDRAVCALGNIRSDHIAQPNLMDDGEWARFTQAVQTLDVNTLRFVDKAGAPLEYIKNYARKQKKTTGLSVLIIDYLQLMTTKGSFDTEALRIESITTGLKNLAMELDIAVILLSQLNRELEKRTNKRPTMSDLRGSGSIEQDADVIVFLYRDEVYNPDSMDRGLCEVILGKNRQGKLDMIRLMFKGQYYQFSNYDGVFAKPIEERVKDRVGVTDF